MASRSPQDDQRPQRLGRQSDRRSSRPAGRRDRSRSASEDRAMSFELSSDEQGKLTLKRPGQTDEADVRVRRAFPWSKPDQWISVRSGEGKELLLVEDLGGLE